MLEKQVIGNAEIWLADCKDVLPELDQHDLLLTDPPFGVGNFVQTAGNVRGRGQNTGVEVLWNECIPNKDLFDLMRSKSKHRVIWGANFFNCFETNGGAIVWLKGQKMPNFSKAEIASCTHYKKTEIVDIPWTNFDVARHSETSHPCERPVALYLWCIQYMPDAASILDPFMGSGSTGVAALRCGKKYTGIERDSKYFDEACKRLEAVAKQGVLFDREIQNAPIQNDFLKDGDEM